MKNGNIIRTTVTMNKNRMKALKKIAIDKELTQNQLINDYIEAGISKDKNQI